uniref:Hepatoma-derived growth factor-related protein 2 n=1 Tax=Cajanus cajan TaxID=3821 RepID=A0A151TMW5_CAJCA|nr:Hepatoma-derived growth factor-related protein 2 [Cajanus cajan]
MAPGRRRGANKAKANGHLTLGDLVLAKVKGFPAWPAKISRPEDWEKTPDPKKYFVQFFGTKEIAFVAPADIQAFTNEAKNKLSARLQGKTKYFAQAVKEICAAFDEMQKQKASGLTDDTDDSHIGSEAPSNDGVVGNLKDNTDAVVSNGGKDNVDMDNVGSNLEHCMPRVGENDSHRDRNGGSSTGKFLEGNYTGHGDLSKSEETLKTGKKRKNAFAVKSDSPDTLKSDNNGNTGEKDSNLIKVKTSLEVKNELQEISFDSEDGDGKSSSLRKKTLFHAKHNVGANEPLHATKKLKRMDAQDDSTVGYSSKVPKRASPGSTVFEDRSFKKLELKKSTPNLKTEKSLPSKGQIGGAGSDDSVNELLPATKHHSQVHQVMPDSAGIASDEKKERSSLRHKVDTNNVMIKQVERKRRAVCLFDDDDEPKTPVHGGAAKNIKSSSVSEVKKTSNAHPEKSEPKTPVHENPEKLDLKQFPSNAAKLSSVSPVKSPQPVPAIKSNAERNKASKLSIKNSINATQKRADHGSSKSSHNLSSSQNQVATHRKKLASSAEISKTTPETLPQAVEAPASTVGFKDPDDLHVDRLEVGTEEKNSIYTGSGTPETAKTMKHLIAAALAKRKQAHSQCLPSGFPNVQGGTPSPSTVQPFLPVLSNFVQADMQGVYEQTTLASPPTKEHHSASHTQLDADEIEDRRIGSAQRGIEGSLSGGTEAAVSREAFEGMIETLSRTKESIGRATRLAIDCAKYGIANEVVELLIRKLENETSFHRKVDLFFLVDSITQCSHNQKGIAGASYIPTVQAALPRLLGAAAPPGASARENRRQCLKVLRLWLERKIFPESVLRRYMDDIGVSNDDMTVSFSLRRPSRAERAVDDPIREMEGMLVDEYGSNATFQLPGFLSSRPFEDDEDEYEDDIPINSCKETCDASPADPTHILGESETSTVTPNDKRHCILKDVDGELEMEDVSGHPKDERPLFFNSSEEIDLQHQGSDRNIDPTANISEEMSATPDARPLLSQSLMPPQSAHQSSPQLGYQQSVPHDFSGTTNSSVQGNQIVPMAGNSFPGGHNNAVVQNEVFPQPSAYAPAAGCSSQEPSGFNHSRQLEYGQNDMFLNAPVPQPNHQFQQSNPPFVQRHAHPAPPQNPPNPYSYSNPTVQQHLPHSFHPPFPLPSLPDGRRQFVADEQWRVPSSEFKTNNQHGVWRGRNPSCPGPPYGQEGHFRPTLERPPVSSVGFQRPISSNLPVAPGHGVPQMMPCRPDIPAVNCWRPN